MSNLRYAGLAGLLLAVVAERPALADSGENESQYDPGKPLRRGDVAMGLLIGGAAGSVTGYPNEIAKIDDPRFEASTGLGGGVGGGFWLGGALRDWFVFGLGLTNSTVAGKGNSSTGTTFIFHLETYPLFPRGGVWQDLGILAEFGAGGRSVSAGGVTVAEGGLMSNATLGLVYDGFRVGDHLSLGPLVEVTYQGSQSLTATYATIGLRTSLFTGGLAPSGHNDEKPARSGAVTPSVTDGM